MDNTYRIYGVAREILPLVWPHAAPLIEKALRYSNGSYTIDDIFKLLASYDMQLWIICNDEGVHGICITEITIYPREKCLYIVLLAGLNFKKWAHLYSVIYDFAHIKGCDCIRIKGRKGWFKSRILKKFGFHYAYTAMQVMVDKTKH